MIIGLIGKPSSGKSTFFKSATLAEVDIAPYPFTTIDKNEGVGFVKVKCIEKEFDIKCQPKFGFCLEGMRFIPIRLIDVAGLIPGSHLGKGRGNQFLSDLIQADVLIHIIDVSGSTNEKGEAVTKLSYDPCNDVKFLEEEIDMWFFELIKKKWDLLVKHVQQDHEQFKKEIAKQFSGMKIKEEHIEETIKKISSNKKLIDWDHKDLQLFVRELRKLSKPIIIVANKIDIEGAEKNLGRLKLEFPDYLTIGCSAESELALREATKHNLIEYIPGSSDFKILNEEKLSEKQKNGLSFIKEFLKKYKTTGVQDILNKAVFEFLKYIAVYPVANSHLEDKDGNKLPDCILVPEDTTTLEFASRVHTDLAKNFIKAIDMKTKKALGKEHKLNNNDVIEIVTK